MYHPDQHHIWHCRKVCRKIVSLTVVLTLANCRHNLQQQIVALNGMPALTESRTCNSDKCAPGVQPAGTGLSGGSRHREDRRNIERDHDHQSSCLLDFDTSHAHRLTTAPLLQAKAGAVGDGVERHAATVSGIMSNTEFASLELTPQTQEAIQEMGFVHMTEVQARTIPHLLTGRDVLGAAKTGKLASLQPLLCRHL